MQRWFGDERGSVVGELTFGATVVGILVIGGLWVVAQLEGVSFQVLLEQLRNGGRNRAIRPQPPPGYTGGVTFRRLLGFLRPYRGQVALSAALAIASQAVGLPSPT